MKHKILKHKKILAVVACLLVISTLIGVYTYSKYTSTEKTNGEVELEEFYTVARLYYTKNGSEQEVQILQNDNNIKYVEMTPDEFKTLRVDIEYSGEAKVYCRFKLDCSWYHKINVEGENRMELIPHEYPTYTCRTDIYNNIQKDGWLYFTEILEADKSNSETRIYSNALTVDNIGNDVSDLINEDDKSEYVRIAVTVDCVQYNRAKALWKMTSLPWEEAESD